MDEEWHCKELTKFTVILFYVYFDGFMDAKTTHRIIKSVLKLLTVMECRDWYSKSNVQDRIRA